MHPNDCQMIANDGRFLSSFDRITQQSDRNLRARVSNILAPVGDTLGVSRGAHRADSRTVPLPAP